MSMLKTLVSLALASYGVVALAGETGGFAKVTGGGDAKPVYAKTMRDIEWAVFHGDAVVIYTGNEDEAIKSAQEHVCWQWGKMPREMKISASNITIIGAPGSSANFGIRITGGNNIIIQDMTMGMMAGGARNGDILGIDGGNNIWIHHNNLFSQNYDCPGTPDNDTTFDGMMDIRGAASNITVSYNLLHDHPKVGLDGSSDKDAASRLLTFHHNIYTNVRARLPLQRFGYTHEYNNIYHGIEVSGINVRMGGQALVEGNWFEDAQNPVTSRDSAVEGYWDLRNNNITGPADFERYRIRWEKSPKTLRDATDWVTTKPFPDAVLTYTYKADPVLCVHEHLAEVAGPNKGDKTLDCAATR